MGGLSPAQGNARSSIQSAVAHSPPARAPTGWQQAVGELFDMLQLLSPDVRAIAIAAPTPQRDRAPDWLAAGTPARLRDDLVALLAAIACSAGRSISCAMRATRVRIGSF